MLKSLIDQKVTSSKKIRFCSSNELVDLMGFCFVGLRGFALKFANDGI